jgi:hypothetical protein
LKHFEKAEDFERPPSARPQKKAFSDHELLQSLLLSEGETLSERSRVEIFLSAVNAGGIRGRDAIRIGSGLRRVVGLEKSEDDDSLFQIPTVFIDHWRQLLGAVACEPSIINPIVCMHLALGLHGKIVAVPAPGLTREGFAMSYRIAATGVYPALDYANVLLLSNFVNDLCQCHLPTCGIFFLAEPVPVGRPRREYCTEKHREDFFKRTGADRVAASRAGETAERWREIRSQYPDMTPTKWKALRARKHK